MQIDSARDAMQVLQFGRHSINNVFLLKMLQPGTLKLGAFKHPVVPRVHFSTMYALVRDIISPLVHFLGCGELPSHVQDQETLLPLTQFAALGNMRRGWFNPSPIQAVVIIGSQLQVVTQL